ncbi:TRAP transporter small permease [Georgenia yuyongxinii]|uniref:TRAP transporter small permease n=1 Tax=Georgenia yuyongxinii TaxID=2589797 RepID=A0A5B8C107_9MICO|nr:TRAP transporter small permease [Georgenia yuyongxinii]QDC23777.1 TRAP transporter small permease [Georgenia yuyongxinii]
MNRVLNVDTPHRIAAAVSGAAAVALMLWVVADVTMRYVVNSPIAGTLDYVTYVFMPGMSLFGIVVAQHRKEHIDVPILTSRLPEPLRSIISRLSLTVFLVAALAFMWFGYEAAFERMATGEMTSTGDLNIAPWRWMVPVAMALLVIQLVLDLLAPQVPDGVDEEIRDDQFN